MSAVALSGAHILITGGAGFIGSHLVEQLSKSGSNRLRVLDTLRRDALRPAGLHSRPNVELVEGDVMDRPPCAAPWTGSRTSCTSPRSPASTPS